MKNLSTAIFSKFTGSAFATSIGGRLYKGRAPQNPTWPYAVYFIVSDVPQDTFTEGIEEVRVQFSIFSKASSSTEIEDAFASLWALFDDCVLSITSATHLSMTRGDATLTSGELDVADGSGEYWQYDVDYDVLMKRN